MKKILFLGIVITIVLSGCVLPEDEGVGEETKIITANASELKLTIDDLGDEWHVTGSGAIWSKEFGLVTDYRYSITDEIEIFPDINSAKDKFAEYKKLPEGGNSKLEKVDIGDELFLIIERFLAEIIFRYKNIEKVDIGDESFLIIDRFEAEIIFRYKNIVVDLYILDYNEKLDSSMKEDIIHYARLIERKVKEAAEDKSSMD